MPRLRIGPPISGEEVYVGRLAEIGAKSEPDCPSSLSLSKGAAEALTGTGGRRDGRPADVKPGVHWLLMQTSSGDCVIRPVTGWYEFGKIMHPNNMALTATEAEAAVDHRASSSTSGNKGRKRALEEGELELKQGIANRKANADRWEQMMLRREERLGGPRFTREQIFSGAARVGIGAERKHVDDEERLKDELGLEREKHKKIKALKKALGALDKAEDEEVPDTANALLKLKSEKAEGVWDFSAEDEFSDDEQEQDDFNDELENKGLDEQVPSADEDDAPEAEDGDLLTQHGKQIEVLIQQYGSGGSSVVADDLDTEREKRQQDDQADAEDEEVEMGVEPLAASPPQAGRQPAQRPSASAAASRAAPRAAAPCVAAASASGPSAAAAVANQQPSPAAAASSSSGPSRKSARTAAASDPATTASPAAAASAPPGSAVPEPLPSDAELRNKVIDCLLSRGGSCRLAEAAAALGLKDKQSALYQRAVAILKEVASVEKVPGEPRPSLVLKPEHRKP